jgi:hypothetical protein
MLTLAPQPLLQRSANISTMAFERIKTVNGHQYKYLVENVRENGKTKQKIVKYFGRIDKPPQNTAGLTIPYGVYYFTQTNCQHCRSEDRAREFSNQLNANIKEEIDFFYINLSKMKNPIPVPIEYTPCWVVSCSKGLKIADDFSTDIYANLFGVSTVVRADEDQDLFNISITGEAYERLLRRRIYPEQSWSEVINNIIDGNKEQRHNKKKDIDKCDNGVCSVSHAAEVKV